MLQTKRNAFGISCVLLALAVASPASAVERKLLVASFENIVVIGDIDVSVETGKPVSAAIAAPLPICKVYFFCG